MRVNVTWQAPMRFDAEAEGGTRVVMDALPQHGGTGAGPSPMQTVLAAVAGCTGMDVVSILNKMRAPLEALAIGVEAERASEHPKIFTKIHLRYEFSGPNLQREQVEKAVALSMEKYCSVSAMLKKAAEVTYEIVLNPVAAAR
ncbi:MAG: OsmC family protein [Armatimonadota bacterium]|nr:OsmC family protein [Armatimonadota bacterium]